MAKFMLTRNARPGAYPGVKLEERPAPLPPIRRMIEVKFAEHMRVVDVPDDIDLSSWVESGHLVAIRQRVKEAKPEPEVKPTPEPEPEVEPEVEPEPEPEPEPEVEEPTSDYEETADGGYKCLHCGKKYKSSSRAESFIQKHVEDNHL